MLDPEVKIAFDVRDEGIFYGLQDPDEDRYPMVPWTAAFKSKEGATLAFWWLPWRMQEIVVPARADLTIQGAAFRDPVLVDLLGGEVYPVVAEPTGAGLRLVDMPLADVPYALVERAHVELL